MRNLIEALSYIIDGIASNLVNCLIIPHRSIQCLQAFVGQFAILEEAAAGFLLTFYALFIYVHCKNTGACRYLGRSVFKEFGIVELEFAYLEGHVVNGLVQVTFQKSQEALHGLNGSRKVKIETHGHYNIGLEIDERLLAHVLFFFVSKKVYHSRKTRRNRLFYLGRQKYTDCCKAYHLGFLKVLRPNHIDVAVQNAGCMK